MTEAWCTMPTEPEPVLYSHTVRPSVPRFPRWIRSASGDLPGPEEDGDVGRRESRAPNRS